MTLGFALAVEIEILNREIIGEEGVGDLVRMRGEAEEEEGEAEKGGEGESGMIEGEVVERGEVEGEGKEGAEHLRLTMRGSLFFLRTTLSHPHLLLLLRRCPGPPCLLSLR